MPGKSGAVRAGGAFVELFTDDSKLARGLKAASGKLKSWGKDVQSIGRTVFAAGAVVKTAFSAATGIFAEIGAELAHMSDRTGIGVASLSQLKYAADQSGVGMEDFETSIKKMQKTLGQASIGNKQAQQSLRAIGLSIQDLINLSPEEQFEAIAAKIAAIPNPAQRAAAAMSIFGKNGTAILPMLLKGADGIQALKAEADRLGLTMSAQDAKAALALDESMRSVWATLKGVAIAVGSALAPMLTDLAQQAASVVGNFVNWIKENRGLIVTVSTIATGVAVAGAAIIACGYAVSFLAPAFAGLGMAISAAGAGFGLVVSMMGAILSPIGLIAAALVGLVAYFVSTSDAVKDAISGLSDVFTDVSDDFKEAFDAIKAALSAGDFTAAINVLWAFIRLEFTRGIVFIKGLWIDLKGWMAQLWDVDLFFGLKQAWIDTIAFMESAWIKLQQKLSELMAPVQNELAEAWIKFNYSNSPNRQIDPQTGQVEPSQDEVLKTFREDQARRGGRVISDEESKKKLDDVEAERKRQTDANQAAHQKAIDEYKKTHQPGLNAAARQKTQAELDGEKDLNAWQAKLHAAIAAAHAAKHRTPHAIAAAADRADLSVKAVGKSGKAVGTFSSSRLEGLGSGNAMDKIADNTAKANGQLQQANQSLKQLVQSAQQGGAFA